MCGCLHRSDHDLAALYFSMLPNVSNSKTKFAEQTLRHWQTLSASRCQRNPTHRSYEKYDNQYVLRPAHGSRQDGLRDAKVGDGGGKSPELRA